MDRSNTNFVNTLHGSMLHMSQTDRKYRIYSKNHILFISTLTVVLTLKTAKHFFLHDTPSHDNTLPYQVWLQKVEQFRRYSLRAANPSLDELHLV